MSTPERPPDRRVALVGAGAVGLSLASAISATGRRVAVCGGSSVVDSITVVDDGRTSSWPVDHILDPDELDDVDIMIVAVKAHHTAAVGPWLQAASRHRATVVVAQNGVEHRERVAPYVGTAPVVPAVVYLNAKRVAPGEVVMRRVGDADVAVPADEGGRRVGALLAEGGLRVTVEPDFATVAWSKLLTNITANPLTALTGRRPEVIRDPAVGAVARQLMTEAAEVARAEGAALSPTHVDDAMEWLVTVPEESTTSMREDRLAGRPLEHDALTGAVIRAAERHGIDVPANRLVLALIAAVRPTVDAAADPDVR